jgi:hypothetical protein
MVIRHPNSCRFESPKLQALPQWVAFGGDGAAQVAPRPQRTRGRHHQNIGTSGYGRTDLLDLRGRRIDCIVERKRPIQDTADDLVTFGHLA